MRRETKRCSKSNQYIYEKRAKEPLALNKTKKYHIILVEKYSLQAKPSGLYNNHPFCKQEPSQN